MSENMILRVQSPDGSRRVEVTPDDSTAELMAKIQKAFEFDSVLGFYIFKDQQRKEQIPSLERKTIKEYGLGHGHSVYLQYVNGVTSASASIKSGPGGKSSSSSSSGRSNGSLLIEELLPVLNPNVPEDDVDQQLWKQSGLIDRPRDPSACRHGANVKCVHCTPLEPFDAAYLKEQNIKHLSFHSYLRKMTAGVDKGKFAALDNISCKIKPGCKGHKPWPEGICTKCQPSAITLNRQVYRHVDNVVFENGSIVNQFLNYWRSTGHQRIGFLYGNYEVHKDVPLGIKAVVTTIYEPPQTSTRDSINLILPEKNVAAVDHIAAELGLRRVGWIFTDLLPEDMTKGTVKHLRNAETYFLSAQECIMAAYFQTMHPNRCRLSSDGYFGSKFVTVLVTGDKNNQIHMEGYQVSNQCMALVRDNCFLPTKDAPELGYVRDTDKDLKLFVPDVFYKEKDSYGNEISKKAGLLPIEYVLVDVPVSSPLEQRYTFNPLGDKKKPFPIENRPIQSDLQNFNALAAYFSQFSKEQFLEAVSDFHLLLYLYSMDTLPLKDNLNELLAAVRAKNRVAALEWSKTGQWQTVEQLILAQSASAAGPQTTEPQTSTAVRWPCQYCTFENPSSSSSCDMCGLPK